MVGHGLALFLGQDEPVAEPDGDGLDEPGVQRDLHPTVRAGGDFARAPHHVGRVEGRVQHGPATRGPRHGALAARRADAQKAGRILERLVDPGSLDPGDRDGARGQPADPAPSELQVQRRRGDLPVLDGPSVEVEQVVVFVALDADPAVAAGVEVYLFRVGTDTDVGGDGEFRGSGCGNGGGEQNDRGRELMHVGVSHS
ncbi:hypothetical protein LCGC14_1994440, partial [marine sediment metagenome]